MKNILLLLLLCLAFSSCQQDSSPSPEEVVRTYQSLVDHNQFAEAKQLATPQLQAFLVSISEIFPDKEDVVTPTEFIDISCQTNNNTATCKCTMKDEFETFKSVFTLVNSNGSWLIDSAEQLSNDSSEKIEIIEEIQE